MTESETILAQARYMGGKTMTISQRAAMFGVLVIAGVRAGASEAVAQSVVMTALSVRVASPTAVYYRHDWGVDMRQGDGDPRRHTCLSGVYACDAAYYPFHDHIDEGTLQHVDRSFSDGHGGYYCQKGFVWTSHGIYRESAAWTHFRLAGYSWR